MNESNSSSDLPRLIAGYWVSQAIHTAAKLKIADLLADGPKTVGQLAIDCSANENCLYRLMRALASVDIFIESGDRSFALNHMGSQLRSDVAGSHYALAVMMGQENYQAWGQLFNNVKTGETAFVKVFGREIFEHLQLHPEFASVFNRAMMNSHGRDAAGGGNGTLLAAILKRYPSMCGILLELPHVLESAQKNLTSLGVAERCRVLSGDFFKKLPLGADAILMRHVIHNWDDEHAQSILRNCYDALPKHGRLFLVESVILENAKESFAKLMDISMMVLVDGQERTTSEYQKLLHSSGFQLARIVKTKAHDSIVEGRKQY